MQHPKVQECKDRTAPYWFFRYWHDYVQPDGSVKTTRKRHICGATKGVNAISKRRAEIIRDDFLSSANAAATRAEAAIVAQETAKEQEAAVIDPRQIIFGKLAEMWRSDYVDNLKVRLATPTREKYRTRLDNHILPRWKDVRIGELDNSKAVLDWLQQGCSSWWMMIDLRNIMSGIITRAQEWGIIPRSYANPMQWVNIGRKWVVRSDRILTDEEDCGGICAPC